MTLFTRMPETKSFDALSSPCLMTPLELQQFQRLKVNRVAVMQELKVDHVLQALTAKSVLDEADIQYIREGQTTHERSKRLLDILPTKGRTSNWYTHFRAALLNPSVDDLTVRHKYQILVEFLDNTIVEQMKHPVRHKPRPPETIRPATQSGRLNRYSPLPSIVNKQSRAKLRRSSNHKMAESPSDEPMQIFSYHWEKPPADFMSQLKVPEKHLDELLKSTRAADVALEKEERRILAMMQQLEILYHEWQEQRLDEDAVFCYCSPVIDIVSDTAVHHLYFKYLNSLPCGQDILYQVTVSYDELTQWLVDDSREEMQNHLTMFGLNLLDLLTEFGTWGLADQLSQSMMTYLSGEALNSLVPLFQLYVKCMSLSNSTLNLRSSDWFYHKAMAVREKISLISFGKDVLQCSELFVQTSVLMRELGSFGPAYTWAQKAMQEVDLEDKSGVLSVLINASQAYSRQGKVMRAEDLAVVAVQHAKKMFGVYHPAYLKALQNFVSFSNEFRQDLFGVEAAAACVSIAAKLYNSDNLRVVFALQTHARALVAVGQLESGLYYNQAERAYNLAVEKLPVNHPLLATYLNTFALSLSLSAQFQDYDKSREERKVWAEGEGRSLVQLSKRCFGDVSFKMAESLLCLADIYKANGKLREAEESYSLAKLRLVKCVMGKHSSLLLTKYKLASVMVASEQYEKAAELLREIVDNFDDGVYYISWYNDCCEILEQCLEMSEAPEEIIQDYKSKHLGWKWTSEDIRRQISWRELHAPPEKYDMFLERFELWRVNVQKVQDHLEKLKTSNQNEKMSEEKAK